MLDFSQVKSLRLAGQDVKQLAINGSIVWAAEAEAGVNFVDYLESTGKQWIDTGFIPNQDTRIDIEVIPTSASSAGAGVGFIPYGAAVGYDNNSFECYSQNGQFEFNYAGQHNFVGNVVTGRCVKLSHNKNNAIVTIDDDYAIAFTYKTFTAPYTLALFATHRAKILCGWQKIYSCQIYDNDVLIRDYWPCLDPNGVACMYDKVNKEYVYNAGTGDFIAGVET